MTLWAWTAGIVGSGFGSWLGAAVFDSNVVTAILSIGVALAWTALYWVLLDKHEMPDHTVGRSVLLAVSIAPVCVALIVLLGIETERQLWFGLGVLASAQIYGVPTARLHARQAPTDDE
jgi:hypothetical protein